MKFLINKTYRIRLSIDGHPVTYTALILEDDINFVKFRDMFGKEITINKQTILSIEEVVQ